MLFHFNILKASAIICFCSQFFLLQTQQSGLFDGLRVLCRSGETLTV